VQGLNLDLDWEGNERWEDAAGEKAARAHPLETGEPAIDTEDPADQEPLQTPHADVEVATPPLSGAGNAEDDMPKVAAPAGE
jgi:hypothetical protein